MNKKESAERILSRLFAAHSLMFSFPPSSEGLSSFIEKALDVIPGIAAHEVCLLDHFLESGGELTSKFLGKIILSKKTNEQDVSSLIQAKAKEKNFWFYPIGTASAFYGYITIKVCDPKEYYLFEAVVSDFAISISFLLENKIQKKELADAYAELDMHRKHLQNLVQEKTNKLKKLNEKLKLTLDNTIQSLAMTVELRDPYTAGHQYRVAQLSQAIAKKFNFSKEKIREIYLGALIHDIGKIHIPQEILSSPAKLTPLQYEIIKSHPLAGKEIIHGGYFGAVITDIILHHHERLNGSGYPHGLQGDKIPLATKIVSVADVFEAMSSHRPYRPAHTLKETLNELKKHAGELYDPAVVDCCIGLIKEGFKIPPPPYKIPLFYTSHK